MAVALGAAVAAQLTFAAPASATKPHKLVQAIQIDGNAIVPDATLLSLMQTTVDRPFDWSRLQADVRKIDGYYDSHGFGGQVPTHVLGVSFDPITGALALHIREGLTVRHVYVDYDPVVPRALLLEALATRSDFIYSDRLRDADVEGVSELFGRHDLVLGTFAGGLDVRSVDPVNGTADVHYTIAPARIGAIAIDGNVKTADAVIRQKLGLRVGDLVTESALTRAHVRLERTRRFDSVDVFAQPGPDPNAPARITILWLVKERG
jgi:outer membrane protein assembly factor BamA